MLLFLVEVLPTLEEPYSSRCDGVVVDSTGVESRFYDEEFATVVKQYIDCHYGDEQCPPEHREAYEAALAQRALLKASL